MKADMANNAKCKCYCIFAFIFCFCCFGPILGMILNFVVFAAEASTYNYDYNYYYSYY